MDDIEKLVAKFGRDAMWAEIGGLKTHEVAAIAALLRAEIAKAEAKARAETWEKAAEIAKERAHIQRWPHLTEAKRVELALRAAAQKEVADVG